MFKEDLLHHSPDKIISLLGKYRDRFHIEALAECDSTNSVLYEQAHTAPSGTVILTDHQKAGRGSRNRQWQSDPNASLTFSVLWHFPVSMEKMAGLSLAVGVAIARGLEACGAQGIGLKWPNDILYQDRKLGGILVELIDQSMEKPPHLTAAICGIGINLAKFAAPEQTADFPLPVASLDEIIPEIPERHHLITRLLIALSDTLDQFAATGFASVQDEWQQRHAWQGQPVRLLREGLLCHEGICRGADSDGALLVQTADGLERCLAGDLSLRVQRS